MKNLIKVAFLSSIITAALVYVILEWRPLRAELSRPPEISMASSPANTPATPAAPAPITDDEKNNIEIYQKYSQGVVNITTTSYSYDIFYRAIPQSGMGSGAIIDSQGHIVTNYHVVKEARDIQVTLPDKTKHKATTVGSDPNNDLAVIQIDVPRGLVPIPLGTSKGLLVGQKVLAIGNPFGLDRTLTTGIISSLGRSIETDNGRIIEDMIQTDAAINHGNSGGPLLNTQGQIIGINSAIISPSDASAGIGFAIPVDTVRRITDELLQLGYVRHAYLGLNPRGLLSLGAYPGLANALNIDTDDSGLLVVNVLQSSPAAEAGIRGATQQVRVGNAIVSAGGDVILSIQGRNVNSFQELATEVDKHKPGEKVAITVLRGNRKVDVPVTLQEAPRQR